MSQPLEPGSEGDEGKEARHGKDACVSATFMPIAPEGALGQPDWEFPSPSSYVDAVAANEASHTHMSPWTSDMARVLTSLLSPEMVRT